MAHDAAKTATTTRKALLSPWVGQQVGPQTVSITLVMAVFVISIIDL